jgi:hypothetical protein
MTVLSAKFDNDFSGTLSITAWNLAVILRQPPLVQCSQKSYVEILKSTGTVDLQQQGHLDWLRNRILLKHESSEHMRCHQGANGRQKHGPSRKKPQNLCFFQVWTTAADVIRLDAADALFVNNNIV